MSMNLPDSDYTDHGMDIFARVAGGLITNNLCMILWRKSVGLSHKSWPKVDNLLALSIWTSNVELNAFVLHSYLRQVYKHNFGCLVDVEHIQALLLVRFFPCLSLELF